MMDPSRAENSAVLLGNPGDEATRKVAEGWGLPLESRLYWRRTRGQVVHVIGDSVWLKRSVWWASRAGALGVVATPTEAFPQGEIPWLDRWARSSPLPFWTRRFHRFILPSQEEARKLIGEGVALGRLVVIPPGRELRGVYEEVRRMRG